MKHASVKKAFEKAGYTVEVSDRHSYSVSRGDRFARWYVCGSDTRVGSVYGSDTRVGSVYVSSAKREEEWGWNDGCAGTFYDSVSGAVAAFECFHYASRLVVGTRIADVLVSNNCRAVKAKLTYSASVYIYVGGKEACNAEAAATRRAAPGYFEFRVTDKDDVQFLRSEPHPLPLRDWLTERCPGFAGTVAARLSDREVDMVPGAVGRSQIEVFGVAEDMAEVAVPPGSLWRVVDVAYEDKDCPADTRWTVVLLNDEGADDPRGVSYEGAWANFLQTA